MTTLKTIGPAISILAILRDYPQARPQDIAADLGLGQATVKRDIALLRQLGVVIRWDARSREYNISDFGIFNPDRLHNPLDGPPRQRRQTMSAEELRAIRKATGLSQAKFANRLGRGVGSLRNWEQEIAPIPEEVINDIRALSTTPTS